MKNTRMAYSQLFAQPWHQIYFKSTRHQSSLYVCLDPLPTLQHNEPVIQVLKQVVNQYCLFWPHFWPQNSGKKEQLEKM